MPKRISSLGIGLSVVIMMACSHGSDREPSTATKAAPTATAPTTVPPSMPAVMDNADAVSEIVRARCDRAQACNEVGQDKDFESGTTCMRQLGYDVQRQLRAEDCPGVRKNELEKCVTELRTNDCAKMLDSIERSLTCKKAQLCTE